MKNWVIGRLLALKELHYRIATRLFNPSRLLMGMLIVLFVAYCFFIILEKGLLDQTIFAPYKFGMDKRDWVPATGIFLAAAGWSISSMVTIRNSVKQHTINTLLQTRLSATYQDMAKHVRIGLKGCTPESPATFEMMTKDIDTQLGVEYLLNYIEFMAVGIRHGDLHEGVLKDSMRGIVQRYTLITQVYIDECRAQSGPRTYQNLLWLRKRWRNRVPVIPPKREFSQVRPAEKQVENEIVEEV